MDGLALTTRVRRSWYISDGQIEPPTNGPTNAQCETAKSHDLARFLVVVRQIYKKKVYKKR